jgi:hypothetical protein
MPDGVRRVRAISEDGTVVKAAVRANFYEVIIARPRELRFRLRGRTRHQSLT